MDISITVALIGLAAAVIVALIAQWGIARKSRKEIEKKNAVFEAVIKTEFENLEYTTSAKLDQMHAHTSTKIDALAEVTGLKIDTLTKKVDKHNHIVERMYSLEANFADEKEVCNRRFDIIEQALPRKPENKKEN
jgi:Na+/glutamate symporter